MNRFLLGSESIKSQMPDHPGRKEKPGRRRAFDKQA
jgi:hypothetical protein